MKNIALCSVFLFTAGAVLAADAPPEIDFTQVLKTVTGENMTNCLEFDDAKKKCVREEPFTLSDAAVYSLEAMTDKDRGTDPKVKFERDQLARKVYKNAHATLSVDEIKMLKDRIGEVGSSAQIGAAWPILDPSLSR